MNCQTCKNYEPGEVNKKCHWESDVFMPCSGFNGYVTTGALGECRCAKCREDVRKPDPETWEPGNGFKYEWVIPETRLPKMCETARGTCKTCSHGHYTNPAGDGGCRTGFWKRIGPVEPLVARSGGTWVAERGGENLICFHPEYYTEMQEQHNIPDERMLDYIKVTLRYACPVCGECTESLVFAVEEDMDPDAKIWTPYPETLTDEHAKLRPLVFRWDDDRDISTKIGELVAVTSGEKYPYRILYRNARTTNLFSPAVRFEPQHRHVHSWKHARLATPEELQEAGK